ncbi:dihydrofolate reductase family protein [Spirilliplanes yamanashiensis]|uniref:Deaminase reductase n=1 Tax=Spirilliplanes yamanashiensis TaxID=42233 RepID=A0A8J4DJ38_9ACTN|nr:dihydrofolate reductase family protein [Spirilliplanes yamanashiensis]MDP9817380.1 dihydrofolate reductase [Spirilliplanes yamanashiensis]GIJ02969.1 deaminase reductase [Spirilliplanes yamanashiensis]
MELSVNTFVSLDGVMQGPGSPDEDTSGGFDRGGWLVPHSSEGQLDPVDGWFARADAVLLGRTTFELMRGYWPQVTDPDNPVATALNGGRKYVASTTLADADAAWGNTIVLRGDVVEQVRRLKEQPGGELQVHGSWRLARSLHDAGLVDVYRLIQFPVVVGAGKRLFDGAAPASYRITESAVLPGGAGVVSLTLRRSGDAPAVGAFTVVDGREAIA